MMLAIVGSCFLGATAKKPAVSIAKTAGHKKATKEEPVQNFKVCKNDIGYTVCGQTPAFQNSTYREPVYRAKHAPDYETDAGVVIVLQGIMEIPKVIFPYNQPGPTAESGAFTGVNSWNGAW